MHSILNSRRSVLAAAVLGVAGFTQFAPAAVILKANNSDRLLGGSSWVGGVVPTGVDDATWDSTVTGPTSPDIRGAVDYLNLVILNPGGDVTIRDGTSGGANVASTLSFRTSIDLSNATVDLFLNQSFTRLFNTSGAFNVAAGRTLTVNGATVARSGTTTLTINGAGNVVLNGNASNGSGALNAVMNNAAGTLTLAGTNGFGGGSGFNLAAGTLVFNNNDALNGTRFDFSNGTVRSTSGDRTLNQGAVRLTGNGTVDGTNSVAFAGTFTNTNGNRTLTNSIAGGSLTLANTVALSNDLNNRTLNLAGAGNTLVSGAIVNGSTSTAGNLAKAGAGTLTTTGTNAYNGTTAVNGGTLLVNGTHNGAGDYAVAAAGTLGGTGAINFATDANTATIDGTLTPGSATAIESLEIGLGNVVLGLNSVSAFQIDLSADTFDELNVANALAYGGTLNVDFTGADSADASYDLFDFATQGGAFTTVAFSGLGDGQTATFDPTTGVVTVAVPEPAMLGLGLVAGLVGLRRRRA